MGRDSATDFDGVSPLGAIPTIVDAPTVPERGAVAVDRMEMAFRSGFVPLSDVRRVSPNPKAGVRCTERSVGWHRSLGESPISAGRPMKKPTKPDPAPTSSAKPALPPSLAKPGRVSALERALEKVARPKTTSPAPAAPLSGAAMTANMEGLVTVTGRSTDVDALLAGGLGWLEGIAPYDIAAVFIREGDVLVLRAARGPLAKAEHLGHRLPLSAFPGIAQTMVTGRARGFDAHVHGTEGDPFDDLLGFEPGHACLVAPLKAGEATLGILTLDRSVCSPYADGTVQLVQMYAGLLGLAIDRAAKATELERLKGHAEARAEWLEREVAPRPATDTKKPASRGLREAHERARQVAAASTPVLVLGETGTGKERMARLIHGLSPRANGPFVKINCAAIPAGLLESELFGHVKGAFTGAVRDRPGRFAAADGGTLLLDEIGDLPLDLQSKLLRVLQEGTFEPVGSDRTVRADVRVLAATHVDLPAAVAAGRFREDLYYRLAVFPVTLPPLRERLEDLPELASELLVDVAVRAGRRGLSLGADAIERLGLHTWPGNVRELANVLERAAILCGGTVIGAAHIEVPGSKPAVSTEAPAAEPVTMAEASKVHIARALELSKGRIYGPKGAAARLGLKPSTLQSRMKKLGMRYVD